MSFTWGEISKWAKAHGYKVSKKDGSFLWHNIDNVDVFGEESSLENMVKAVFNEVSEHKWVKHQEEYESKK